MKNGKGKGMGELTPERMAEVIQEQVIDCDCKIIITGEELETADKVREKIEQLHDMKYEFTSDDNMPMLCFRDKSDSLVSKISIYFFVSPTAAERERQRRKEQREELFYAELEARGKLADA